MAKKAKEVKLEKVVNEDVAQTPQPQIPPMPELRVVPRWAPDAKISITGIEWEAIQNGLANIQIALQASQAVMTRNIVEGTILVDIEKLNPQNLQYEQMTDEEKAPHLEQLRKQIEAAHAAQK